MNTIHCPRQWASQHQPCKIAYWVPDSAYFSARQLKRVTKSSMYTGTTGYRVFFRKTVFLLVPVPEDFHMKQFEHRGTKSFKIGMVTATTLFILFTLSSLAFSQQQTPPPNPPDQGQQQVAQQPQSGQPGQPQSMPTQPPPGYSDQQYSNEDQAPPSQDQRYQQDQRYPQGAPYGGPQVQVPSTLTLSPGTLVTVRLNEWISSDRNQTGDTFSVTLDQPLIANGFVVARHGQVLLGRISEAQKAGRVKGTSKLGVELNQLTFVDGQSTQVKSSLIQTSAGTSNGRDAAAMVTTTGVGAAIGAAAVDSAKGAGIGAGIGAFAGLIGILSTPGRPTELPPESSLTFRLEEPITINTSQSQFAFRPVSQQDYAQSRYGSPRLQGRPGYGPGGYPVYYGGGPYYPYYGPAYYSYPYYGYGPVFYFRGGYRHWR